MLLLTFPMPAPRTPKLKVSRISASSPVASRTRSRTRKRISSNSRSNKKHRGGNGDVQEMEEEKKSSLTQEEIDERHKLYYMILESKRFNQDARILPPDTGIGNGGHAVVFRGECKHRVTGEWVPCAIKVEDFDGDIRALLSEKTILSWFDAEKHPNVCELYRWFQNIEPVDKKQGRGCCAMTIPFYDETVRDSIHRIRESKWDRADFEDVFFKFAMDTLSALQQCASVRVVHSDLGPRNLMWKFPDSVPRRMRKMRYANPQMYKDGKVVLIDFGASRIMRKEREKELLENYEPSEFNIRGTPRYRSLNLDRQYPVTFRDDLESLGYVWIEFLMGRIPWSDVEYPENATKAQVEAVQQEFMRRKESVDEYLSENEEKEPLLAWPRKLIALSRNLDVLGIPDFDSLNREMKHSIE